MSATIRISAKAAREILAGLDAAGGLVLVDLRAVSDLRSALSALDRKRTKRAPTRALKSSRARTKKERMAECRAAVFARSEGRCELLFITGATATRCDLPAEELEHAFGRKTDHDKYSPECCFAVCRGDHRAKTELRGGAETWQRIYEDTFLALGLRESARRCSDRRYFVQALSLLDEQRRSRMETTP